MMHGSWHLSGCGRKKHRDPDASIKGRPSKAGIPTIIPLPLIYGFHRDKKYPVLCKKWWGVTLTVSPYRTPITLKTHVIKEKPTIYKPKKNKVVEKTGYYEEEAGDVLEPEIGSLAEGEDAPLPSGHNRGDDGNPHETEDEGGLEEGDSDVLKYVNLTGIKYRFMVINKEERKYAIVFDSPIDEEDCEMTLSYVDDSGIKYPVQIEECLLNKYHCNIIGKSRIQFDMFENKRYSFEVVTDQEELFACEVKIYAYR